MTNSYTSVNPSASRTVSGSGYTLTVYPGQIRQTSCYTNVSGSPSRVAASAYTYTISFVDLWNNLHYQTLSDEISRGMIVSVFADYINHSNYPSPIGIPDLSGWATTYGTRVTGSASDTNNGKMTASLTIRRAGTYRLYTKIDNTNVAGSPFSYLEVTPTSIHAPSCVAQSVPTQMMAGFSYSFKIQGRDQYSNNLLTNLASAVGSNKSAVMSLSTNSGVTYTASIVDSSSAGVYQVNISLPKTQTTGTYNYNVRFYSATVPTSQVSIIACTNAHALSQGFVAAAGSTVTRSAITQLIENSAQYISLTNVAIYCTHTRTQTFESGTVSLNGGSATSLTLSQLNGYGISILQSSTTPRVQVNPQDATIRTATFSLTFKSTVTEETTWADYTATTVNFINPSFPSTSTIETHPATHIAGTVYTVTLQSRNHASSAVAWGDDTYTVTLTRSDGGSESYTTTATHLSNGNYQAQLTPLASGVYSLAVTMTNDYQV